MSHLLHVFPLISLHELTPITEAYQWNAHDHFEQTITWNKYSTSNYGQERGMSLNKEQKTARAETSNMVSLSKAWALEQRHTNA